MTGILVPIAFFVMVAVIIVGLPLARAYARRLEQKPNRLPESSETLARLERIEQALEAVATEVERIAEGQRFTTKLLADTRHSALPPGDHAPHSETSDNSPNQRTQQPPEPTTFVDPGQRS
jgi:hypothetical protein